MERYKVQLIKIALCTALRLANAWLVCIERKLASTAT